MSLSFSLTRAWVSTARCAQGAVATAFFTKLTLHTVCRYVINVKSSKLAPEFLWQIRVLTEPYRWTTVAWPWEQMIFVRRGRFSLEQMTVDAEHFGGVGAAGLDVAVRCRSAGDCDARSCVSSVAEAITC